MSQFNQIRVIVLGLICHNDKLFVYKGYDEHKKQEFYRALGGGVDFGETSIEALLREFREEIQAELSNFRYLGCIESIFINNNQPGHEIIQVYSCDFANPKYYDLDKINFIDGNKEKTGLWIETGKFKSGELILHPKAFLDYI